MGTSVESSGRTTAAFFDLDKTIIARSSTLAFAPSFYRHGLITRSQVCRGAVAQLTFRLAGAGHGQMERIRDQVSALCSGWPADVVAQIVTDGLRQIIVPHVYAEARSLLARHQQDGHDVIIVSTSGQEIAGPIGAMLGATDVIATRLEVATAGTPAASPSTPTVRPRQITSARWPPAWLPACDCFAYSDSVTDLPLLELVGHPHVVNPIARCAGGAGPALARTDVPADGTVREPARDWSERPSLGMEAARSIEITNRSRCGLFKAGGSPVERKHGPLVRTRQPGTHARPAAGGVPWQANSGRSSANSRNEAQAIVRLPRQ